MYTYQNNDRAYFSGTCPISQSDSFTLSKHREPSSKIQCKVTNAGDDKFTLTTTGVFEGTFEMKFDAWNIERVGYISTFH